MPRRTLAKTSARRASPTRRAPRARRAPTSVVDLSATGRARVFREVRKALAAEGLSDNLAALQFDAPTTPADARSMDAGPCPPGQIQRVVCFRDGNGTVVCELRCQPV